MIYKILKFWANIAIRVFYGKIEVSGLENIPKDGPLLIASNHPNGFLEPIIIACVIGRPFHFMVRGDVFRKKWLRPILVNTNQIPIFRFKDGFKELRKNDASLVEAYKALDNDAAIILFIEGGTEPVKTLRPFQKGLARMAYSYIARVQTSKPLKILPVAINFISPFVLRSRVVLNIGETIEAKGCFDNEETRVKDIKKLTDDLYSKIEPMALNVASDQQTLLNHALRLAEGLFDLPFFPQVKFKREIWPTIKSISDIIKLDTRNEGMAKELNEFRALDPYEVKRTGKNYWIALFWTIVTFAPALIGLGLNIIPGIMAKRLAKKVLDQDNTVFIASIILSSGVGFYVIYYFIVILVLTIIFGWYGLLFLLAWPLGFVYLFWKNNFRSSFGRKKYHHSDADKAKLISIFEKYGVNLENITT